MAVYVGLDLSLLSPGIALLDSTTDQWHLFGFAQRQREHGLHRHQEKVTVTMLPPIPSAMSASNNVRYEHIQHHIVETVLRPFVQRDVRIGFESYAFGARNAGSSYKLQELGGVVKHAIWSAFPHWKQSMITPTQWKKKVVGNGKASKQDAIRHMQSRDVPIMKLLGLRETISGHVPNPAQDIADACCIALTIVQSIKE